MISGKQLHGLKVLTPEGAVGGIIDDLIAEKQTGKIQGFIVNLPGLISATAFLSVRDIRSMDLAGIVIPGKKCLKRMTKDQPLGCALIRIGDIETEYGYITDILLDDKRISAVEVSQGIWSDICQGRRTIPWDKR